MYAGPLLKALTRTWGNKRAFTIRNEDRKGNQSGKGIQAKEAANIRALTLPPGTPAWNPLDYSIWAAVDQKMLHCEPEGHETREDLPERLRHCATHLPRGFAKKVIGRMKANIQGVIDACGYQARNG